MIGGDAEVVEALTPCWEAMGKTFIHQGPAGAGQHTKMVNQTLIATGIIGVCEALLYAYKAGLDIETVLKSVSGGAAGSWSLTNYGPRLLANNLDPGFYVEHFVKDMRIALQEAARMKLALPGLALAQQLFTAMECKETAAWASTDCSSFLPDCQGSIGGIGNGGHHTQLLHLVVNQRR